MGWAFCGTNQHGQEIGYGVKATCDEDDCEEEIDRGLGYLCGDMHDDETTCARYYCEEHRGHRGNGSCVHLSPHLDIDGEGPTVDAGGA